MLRWSQLKLHSPCSGVAGVRARRSRALLPSAAAAPERYVAELDGALTPGSNQRYAWPSAPTSLHKPHPPKSAAGGGSGPIAAPVPAWHHPGPGCWPDVPPPLAANPEYLLRYVACGPSLFCQRRNLAAPFFSGLYRLAIDNSRTGSRFSVRCLTNPNIERVMNLLPDACPPPNPEVVVDQLPGRQVVREQPVRRTYRIPLMISRRGSLVGRPPGLGVGTRGPKMAHSASVKSVG
jgi:hypothetical protein